jgi:maltose alpha-D-glucosyltransferase/alpha-amylase
LEKKLYDELRMALPPLLPGYLTSQRWFGGKARHIRSVELIDAIPLGGTRFESFVLIARVEYTAGSGETYVLPVVCVPESALTMEPNLPVLKVPSQELVLRDALTDEEFLLALLEAVEHKLVFPGIGGEIHAAPTSALEVLCPDTANALKPKPIKAEQSNSSIVYGDCLILKFFRRIEEGINPDLEMGLFLTEKAHFPHIPPVAGSLEYRTRDGRQMTQGILQGFVPNQGDAWQYTLKTVSSFYQEVARLSEEPARLSPTDSNSPPLDQKEVPEIGQRWIGPYLEAVELLGKRTAELHLALASESADPAFAPEPHTDSFQRAFEGTVRELTDRVFGLLRQKITQLPRELRSKAEEVAGQEREILQRFRSALSGYIRAMRTRTHGDYHLGQVLCTGSDFVIIDFEGEPARSISERRIKRSPLQDVAGMLRSFHYAAFGPLLAPLGGTAAPKGGVSSLAPWAESWNARIETCFLEKYIKTSAAACYLPPSRQELVTLLQLHLLEKAVYELGYELNNRPEWVAIPLAGISRLLMA